MNTSLRQIGEKTFYAEDQQIFARISRDTNPMHMDPIAARRLIAGRQVVHGIHLLLTALEYWQNDNASPLGSITCSFNNPVSVGERVVFSQLVNTVKETTIEARINDLLCATITLNTRPIGHPRQAEVCPTETAPNDDTCVIGSLGQPIDETPEFHLNKTYGLTLSDADFAGLFPKTHRHLGQRGIATVAALSYVVGMVCPGLHSVFSSLDIDLHPGATEHDSLYFAVKKYDPRFHLFDIKLGGSVHGGIKAFMRPRPQIQPSVRDLLGYVSANEFKGTRTLIIGGSRGLGEVTAKTLVAGGGNVVITYASGLVDARAICDEINRSGLSVCEIKKLDLTAQRIESIDVDWNSLHAIYFFATPRIFRKKAAVFEPTLFHEFYDFYIEKFYALCVFLEKTITTGRIKVYYPSSVFVKLRPTGMAEYSMIKSAAEVLIQEINRSFNNLTILCTQLPRLSTDQTTSIVDVATEPNVETLLPVIRAMQA